MFKDNICIYDLTDWSSEVIDLFKKSIYWITSHSPSFSLCKLIPSIDVFESKNWFQHFEFMAKNDNIPYKHVKYRGVDSVLPKEIYEVDVKDKDFMPIEIVFKWQQPERLRFNMLYQNLLLQGAKKEDIIIKGRLFSINNQKINKFDTWLNAFLLCSLELSIQYIIEQSKNAMAERTISQEDLVHYLVRQQNKITRETITKDETENLIKIFGNDFYTDLKEYREMVFMRLEVVTLEY